MKKPCILVVEDEARYRELLELNLNRRQFRTVMAADGLAGLNALERDDPDLVLLDVHLPDMDGFELCRRIRAYSTVPIIMLTGSTEEAHKVRGLQQGADDYVTKPFSAAELLARIDAVLRRARRASTVKAPRLVNGGLSLDFEENSIRLEGEEVVLTATEHKLLYHLALNAGRLVVHEDLLTRVWGMGYETDLELLHSAIRRLRRKLKDDARRPRYIVTRRGIGYVLNATEG